MIQCGVLRMETQESQVVASSAPRKKTSFSYRAMIAVCAIGLLGIVLCLNLFDHSQPNQVAVNVPLAEHIPAASEYGWLILDLENRPQVKGHEETVALSRDKSTNAGESLFLAVSDSGKNTVAWRVAYGQYLVNNGRMTEAGDQFAQALELDANSVEAMLGSGLVAYSEKDYATALQLFEKANTDRNLAPLLQFHVEYNAAKSAMKLERWDTAKSHWENSRNLLSLPELAQDSEIQFLMEEIDNELALF